MVAGHAGTDPPPYIGIKKGIVGHGQDLAGRHMDHHAGAGFGVVGSNGLFQLFFGEKLNLGVDGQAHVVAVDVGQLPALGIEKVAPPRSVALDHELGLASGEAHIKGFFQPFQTHVAHAHKAHELAGQMAVGIEPAEFLGEMNPRQGRFPNLGCGTIAHPPGQVDDFLGPHEKALNLNTFGQQPAGAGINFAP